LQPMRQKTRIVPLSMGTISTALQGGVWRQIPLVLLQVLLFVHGQTTRVLMNSQRRLMIPCVVMFCTDRKQKGVSQMGETPFFFAILK
jgi:hypothetical protein